MERKGQNHNVVWQTILSETSQTIFSGFAVGLLVTDDHSTVLPGEHTYLVLFRFPREYPWFLHQIWLYFWFLYTFNSLQRLYKSSNFQRFWSLAKKYRLLPLTDTYGMLWVNIFVGVYATLPETGIVMY